MKCREGTDILLKVFNLFNNSSILQVEQQKLTGFSPLFKFYSCIILFTFNAFGSVLVDSFHGP